MGYFKTLAADLDAQQSSSGSRRTYSPAAETLICQLADTAAVLRRAKRTLEPTPYVCGSWCGSEAFSVSAHGLTCTHCGSVGAISAGAAHRLLVDALRRRTTRDTKPAAKAA